MSDPAGVRAASCEWALSRFAVGNAAGAGRAQPAERTPGLGADGPHGGLVLPELGDRLRRLQRAARGEEAPPLVECPELHGAVLQRVVSRGGGERDERRADNAGKTL